MNRKEYKPVGLFFLITYSVLVYLSIIYLFFPPEKINSYNGYRTAISMKNIQNWDYANGLSGTSFFVASFIYLGFSGSLFYFYRKKISGGKFILLLILFFILLFLFLIPFIEYKLELFNALNK